jgi:hypothetical protein
MDYTPAQKKEMDKLADKYEKRGFDKTANERAKADIDREIREDKEKMHKQ